MKRIQTARSCAFAAIILAALPVGASAQYRDGQPATMARPAAPVDPSIGVSARFRTSYARAGSPRIVVFWNRTFDDEVASRYQDRTVSAETESITRTAGGEIRKRMSDTASGTERVGAAARAGIGSESVDWQVEQAFTAALVQSGARLVDRGMAMRLTGAALGAGERSNIQELETRALSKSADLLIEVLQSNDPRAPNGIVFRVNVRDLRSARQLASVMTSGQPPQPRMGYVAGPNGFVRATAPEPSPSDIGAQVAVTLMSSLANGLR
jgi:hypothetical protein